MRRGEGRLVDAAAVAGDHVIRRLRLERRARWESAICYCVAALPLIAILLVIALAFHEAFRETPPPRVSPIAIPYDATSGVVQGVIHAFPRRVRSRALPIPSCREFGTSRPACLPWAAL